MHKIPFFKPSLGPEETAELIDTLKSGWLTTGAKSRLFEQEFAAYVHARHAVALNSCTAALHLALEAVGLREGQGVLVPTLTFAATAEVVQYFKAVPILVDCRLDDFNMCVTDAWRRYEAAERRGITVAAIVPVHFGGLIGDVEGIEQLAKKANLKIIEDAAHCCPAFYRKNRLSPWQSVGASADVSCFSFYANKPITTGEGGMACTNNAEYANRMRLMSLHGISRDAWKRFSAEGHWYYEIQEAGFKYNLTDLAAAIGLQQLRKADLLHQRREAIAEAYQERLGTVEELQLPSTPPDRVHSWHLYMVRLRLDRVSLDRAQLIEALKQAGIGTSVHYLPLHMHPHYQQRFGYTPQDLPNAAGLYPEVLTLPNYPDMTPEEIDYICAQLKSILARHLRPTSKAVLSTPSAGAAHAFAREAQKTGSERHNGQLHSSTKL